MHLLSTKKGGFTPPLNLDDYSDLVSVINTNAKKITQARDASNAVVAPLQSPVSWIRVFPWLYRILKNTTPIPVIMKTHFLTDPDN